MTPVHPSFVEARRHLSRSKPPDWLIRDLGERAFQIIPARTAFKLKIPIWPGFRLELKLNRTRGQHV